MRGGQRLRDLGASVAAANYQDALVAEVVGLDELIMDPARRLAGHVHASRMAAQADRQHYASRLELMRLGGPDREVSLRRLDCHHLLAVLDDQSSLRADLLPFADQVLARGV